MKRVSQCKQTGLMLFNHILDKENQVCFTTIQIFSMYLPFESGLKYDPAVYLTLTHQHFTCLKVPDQCNNEVCYSCHSF